MMLHDGPVVLAPLRDDDSATLHGWINDRDLVILNGPYRPVSEPEHRSWFDQIRCRADTVIFGIRLADEDRLIGTCQLHGIHGVHRCAELQIRIGSAAQRGQGHGTRAVRLLLRFAFDDLHLHRVFLHVFEANAAAIRSYEKAGMAREGLLRQAAFVDGAFRDVVVMACLATGGPAGHPAAAGGSGAEGGA
jgi:RimJ/RimL family protein N-acetyltransferase